MVSSKRPSQTSPSAIAALFATVFLCDLALLTGYKPYMAYFFEVNAEIRNFFGMTEKKHTAY